jgi:hypothetical protein
MDWSTILIIVLCLAAAILGALAIRERRRGR